MAAVLNIKDLRVSYPAKAGKEKAALSGLSLEVGPGEVFGLLGPNGAGKTTLIKSILGLVNVKSGVIEIFGKPNLSADAKSRIGYMPEVANYYWFMTAHEILDLFGRLAGMKGKSLKEAVGNTLETVGLEKEAGSLVKTFSKGMQSRLNLAQAILHDPALLILDEPFSGLDPLGRIDVRNILKKKAAEGKTIFLSSHELSEAELICDNICIMREGTVLRRGAIKGMLDEKGGYSLENYFLKIITG